MASDLKAMTIKELTKLKKDVAKALATVEARVKREALRAAEKAAAGFGYTLTELASESKPKAKAGKKAAKGKTKAKPKAKAKPKYRNPENPEQTWSGRGRKPMWFNAAISGGADISDLEI
jgi:DNA-binding protein H-NS